jgi:hypothetical protein
MNTEELHNITSNWQITDETVTADPAKLKEAFELTQSEIANFLSCLRRNDLMD